ncbi:hypothetical protein BDW02DRAFT_577753 [Decorospora gaudefroyi]|uniref:SMP domain-containing protein n=1 Tax=Decorospora gaudefroyi TaxID=184978 RepID=A0A6A5KLL5_9PLEO|nr:hypothetical protein BDW02DRAFT_577753 [Decorospora gaudefroyi]
MSDTFSEKAFSDVPSKVSSDPERYFQDQLKAILEKLKTEPGTITTEEARTLADNVAVRDDRAVRIISAVEFLAIANKDLEAAVDGSPDEVTTEVLRTTQSIVSKMQKAVGHTNAPHPEVEAELRKEIAKIEPKIAQGTVTKAEADHLHSLEARAHGHTEKGGITAAAQSVVAKRERQLSLSNGSGTSSSPNSGRSRASSRALASPQQKSLHGREEELHKAEVAIRPKIQEGTITKPEADRLHSLEDRDEESTECI